jgi:hypothetical protein
MGIKMYGRNGTNLPGLFDMTEEKTILGFPPNWNIFHFGTVGFLYLMSSSIHHTRTLD